MPREKEDFRANLELLMARYPGKTMLTTREIADVWGRDIRTVRKVLQPWYKKEIGVSIAVVARIMS